MPPGLPDGPLLATLAVTTDDPLQNVVELPLSGRRITQVTPTSRTLDFGTLTLGVPAQAGVVFRNTGSAPLHILPSDVPAGLILVPPPPYDIAPGDSVEVLLSLTPATEGPLSDSLVMTAARPCREDFFIGITADVLSPVSLADVRIGPVARCEEASGITSLRNNLPEVITVTAIGITGADATFFSVVQPPVLPADLAAGASIELTVHFVPPPFASGTYSAVLRVVLRTAAGEDTVTAALIAEVFDGLVTVASPEDFGDVSAGSSAQRRLLLRNTGPMPVRIEGILSPSAPFVVDRVQPAPPLMLQPGDSCAVTVTFAPGVPGSVTDSLGLQISLPCAQVQHVLLTGNGTGDMVPVRIVLPELAGEPDDTLLVPVLLDGDVSGLSADGWTGTLRFNPTMLHPLGVETAGTAAEGLQVTTDYTRPEEGLGLRCVGRRVFTGPLPLVYVRMLVLIGDNVETPLQPLDFSFDEAILRPTELVDGKFTLTGYCRAGNRVVRRLAGTRLEQNTPNPATQVTVLPFELEHDDRVRIVLRDTRGRELRTLLDAQRPAGRHELRVDVSGLPSGAYVCTMEACGGTFAVKLLVTK
jgi:hypothetical protein